MLLNGYKVTLARICLVWGLLAGCASTEPPVVQNADPVIPPLQLENHSFKRVKVIDPEQVFILSPQQQSDFLAFYYAPERQHLGGHTRLYEYLDNMMLGFDFRGQTYTALETMTEESGNCLSLAILTTAFANLVGIEVRYQRVNTAPVFRRVNDILILSSHVRSHVYQPDFVNDVEDNVMKLGKPKLIIDYFPQERNIGGERVQFEDFLAMFYQNLAAEALVRHQSNLAFSLLEQALELAPYNPETLNMLAVLFSQHGNSKQAEAIYQYALSHTEFSTNIVSNYYLLLMKQERDVEALALQDSYQQAKDDNPYRWIDIAENAFEQGQFKRAIFAYQKALKEAFYLSEAHFGLAKTYYRLGQTVPASSEMQLAQQYAYSNKDRSLYQAKLRVINDAVK